MAKMNLDLTNVAEEKKSKTDFVKAGIYPVKIYETEVVETKTGGYMLNVYMEITDGIAKGASLCDRMNIVNKSEEAVKIGLSRLKLIARLIGHKNPSKIVDSTELHGGKLIVEVIEDKYTTEKGTYDTNKIKEYTEFKASTAAPEQQAEQPVQQEAVEQKKFPWQK